MAADSTLIRGAYKANAPQKLASVKGVSDITKSITSDLNNYIDVINAKHTVRNAEYETYAQSVLDNSDLVGEQYEALYDDLMAGKDGFASASKKDRDLQKRDLVAMAGDYEDYKALREDVAINLDDLSPAFTNSEDGKKYLDILKGEGKRLVNNNGRIGIEVDGEWQSISNIKQHIEDNKIDESSIDALEAFRIKTQDSEEDFNYNDTRTTIMNSLISKGKYNSLINDEIIPGRIFRNDLAESLMNQTYGDLGITNEDLREVEGVNIDDGIDADEAENIIAHLESDKVEMKNVLADYYTTYIQNNGGSNDDSDVDESVVSNDNTVEDSNEVAEGEAEDVVDVLTMNDRANQLVEEGLIEKPKSRADLIKANKMWEDLYEPGEDYTG